MINLKTRSYSKELLDEEDIPFADIRQNMNELNFINTYLGGHRITIEGVKQILAMHDINEPVTICEIGCGGGDNLKAIQKWCDTNKIAASFIGIDLKSECIAFAQQQYPELNAKWITSDYKAVQFENKKPDIIFSSLFCHHFIEAELIDMLNWLKSNCTKGFFINDLHRHLLAYYSIKIMTRVFSGSYLVKNDAPLSVARGFKKKDWQQLLSKSGLTGCVIEWKWAFRYLMVYTAK